MLYNAKLKVVVLLSFLFILGCSVGESDEVVKNNKVSYEEKSSIDSKGSLVKLSKRYVGNIKTMIYASDALNKSKVLTKGKSEQVQEQNQEKINPMEEKLKSIQIIEEENGQEVNFYDLSLEQKEDFINYLLIDEAEELSKKIEQVPQLEDYIKYLNESVEEVVDEYDLTKMSIDEKMQVKTKRNDCKKVKKVDASILFKRLNEKFEQKNKDAVVHTKGISYSFNYPVVAPKKVRNIWNRYANKGDFVVALPNMFMPYSYLNFGKGVRYKVGHAGIINMKITNTTKLYEESTVECWTQNGVSKNTINNWNTPHYVMGVRDTYWKWRWRGFRSGFYKVKRNVSHPYKLASQASKYIGHEYVKWYEFATAKWAAPSRFTCTTLVWYSAKKAYDINISSWWKPLVTPHELVCSDKTYFKAVVW